MLTAADLRGGSARRRREAAIRRLFGMAAGVSVVISAVIVVALVGRALDFLRQIDPSWLVADGWFPRRNQFSIPTLAAGSIIVAGIAMLIAAPLGLASAIYLSEYARPRARRALKPIVELLAGIPSIVVGFFALTVISPDVVQRLFTSARSSTCWRPDRRGHPVRPARGHGRRGCAACGAGLPARGRLRARRAAPDDEHACRGPAATSGIMAAIILGLSRAIGETMVVLIVAGGTGGSSFTLDPLGPGQTATGAMAALAIGSDQVKGSGAAFPSLFFVGLLLFAVTFVLNLTSERFVRRARRHA